MLVQSDFPSRAGPRDARAKTSDAVARRRRRQDRVVQAVHRVQPGQQEEPAREVAELRPRAVERHQHRQRLPVGRRGGGRDPHVLRARMPDCLQQLFNAVYERQLRQDKKTAAQLTSVTTDDRAGRRRAHRRRGGRLPGHGRRRHEGRHAPRRSGSGSSPRGSARPSSGYSWTSDTDISATLQPAIVASVSRLQRRAVS